MFRSFEEFTLAATPCLEECDAFIVKHRLNGAVMVDHLCFKCSSSSEYDQLRLLLESNPPSAYVYQVQLSGRRVAYVGLHHGIASVNHPTRFVELSDKKPAVNEAAGFHHAEIYPTALDYSALITKLEKGGETVELQSRPHHTTHDLILPSDFILRFTQRPLIEKIVEEQLSLIR